MKIYLIITFCVLLNLLCIRAGHDWGGDSFMYLHHAENLAQHKPYAETGYIYNPNYPSIGPAAYPPLWPGILAPITYIFGQNLLPMRIVIIMFYALMLASFAIFLKKRSLTQPFLAVTLIAFNPIFFSFKHAILPDIPFCFAILCTVIYMESAQRSVKNGFIAGFLIFICTSLRTAGLALLPALFLTEIREKSERKFSVILVSTLLFFMILQSHFFPGGASYADQLRSFSAKSTIFNTVNDFIEFSQIIPIPFHWLRIFLFAVLFSISGATFIQDIKKNKFAASFVLFYVLLIILWPPVFGIRYYIPVIPFFIFYLISAVVSRPILIKTTAFIFTAAYIAGFFQITCAPFQIGPYTADAQALFEFISNNTPQDSVCLFFKPRILSYFTKRPAAASHRPAEKNELIQWFKDINAAYYIASPRDFEYFRDFPSEFPENFEEIYKNKEFTVFKFIPR